MRRRRSKIDKKPAEIPMSSMIDVVFLLLIYFLIIHKPLDYYSVLKAYLPTGCPPKNTRITPFMTIDVKQIFRDPIKDSSYYRINGNLWHIDNIDEMLKKTFKGAKDASIVINCGPNASHEKLVRLLNACYKAKVTKLNVVDDARIPFRPRKLTSVASRLVKSPK